MDIPINEHDCLLVIDVQNDFCAGGALAVPDGDAVVEQINALCSQFSVIVGTQDWHPAGHASFASVHDGQDPFSEITMPYGPQTLWPVHCIQGTPGAEFHPKLNTEPMQNVIRKGFRSSIDSYSAFFENDHTTTTGLSGYLKERGVQRVFCVGLATDYCVRFSAEDAIKEGFDTFVIESACRGIDLDGSVEAAKASMTQLGVQII
jgi:nicotinamidase/pyrazinamidase